MKQKEFFFERLPSTSACPCPIPKYRQCCEYLLQLQFLISRQNELLQRREKLLSPEIVVNN